MVEPILHLINEPVVLVVAEDILVVEVVKLILPELCRYLGVEELGGIETPTHQKHLVETHQQKPLASWNWNNYNSYSRWSWSKVSRYRCLTRITR